MLVGVVVDAGTKVEVGAIPGDMTTEVAGTVVVDDEESDAKMLLDAVVETPVVVDTTGVAVTGR